MKESSQVTFSYELFYFLIQKSNGIMRYVIMGHAVYCIVLHNQWFYVSKIPESFNVFTRLMFRLKIDYHQATHKTIYCIYQHSCYYTLIIELIYLLKFQVSLLCLLIAFVWKYKDRITNKLTPNYISHQNCLYSKLLRQWYIFHFIIVVPTLDIFRRFQYIYIIRHCEDCTCTRYHI